MNLRECVFAAIIYYNFILDQYGLKRQQKQSPQLQKQQSMSDFFESDIKHFGKKPLTEKQRLEQKRAFELVQQKLTDSLRDLCLPKLLCEIAAKPTYLLTEKEKHVLSLLK
jgi:hypothetical protein